MKVSDKEMLMRLLKYIYGFNLLFKQALVEEKIHGSFKIDFLVFLCTDPYRTYFHVVIALKTSSIFFNLMMLLLTTTHKYLFCCPLRQPQKSKKVRSKLSKAVVPH